MNGVGAKIVVRGHVQGVGFRYFCYSRAVQLRVTGWVRNQPDGNVSLYVEGDRGNIESLIDELKIGPRSAAIADVQVAWTAFTGKYDAFTITG
ncbi:acylphosphatase [candidate division GN15 bacterium]|uniref:Acylphosphatase n=1 Tax=candidate division GN15 bacterium TaxID=2072418 RepID=A0A855X712_9BACT|nr:MAG: acylphosphatase [candidate division GN15 bacterium]